MPERPRYMISVAAELAGLHPQTLRMYEARCLITPSRSPKNTRLYSQRDVERLKRIQRMTSEEGLNLAVIVAVIHLRRSPASCQPPVRSTYWPLSLRRASSRWHAG